jgi:flagellar hook-basal body complex protein FliE
MAIAAISPIAVPEFAGIAPAGSAPSTGAGGGSFADSLTNALEAVSDSHEKADGLALQAATGDLSAVHDYTVAATEAQLLTQLTVEVRNRAVDAFNDVMRMQV